MMSYSLIIIIVLGFFILFFIDVGNRGGGGCGTPTKIYRGNSDSPKAPEELIIEGFSSANENEDNYLTVAELKKLKVKRDMELHMKKAKQEADRLLKEHRISVAQEKLVETSVVKGVTIEQMFTKLCDTYGYDRFGHIYDRDLSFSVDICNGKPMLSIITGRKQYGADVDNDLLRKLIELDMEEC